MIRRAASSTSASVWSGLRLKRIADCSSSSGTPIACRTGDGSSEPLEHAEPVEHATDPLGPVELVGAEAQAAYTQVVEMYRNLPHCLHGVAVKMRPSLDMVHQGADGLNRPGFMVGQHNAHKPRFGPHHGGQCFR